MSKVIPFSELARQQHLNFLNHKRREYQEREDYLLRLRRLLFQIEGQMRQAEIQQMDLLQQMAAHFHIPLKFPDLGDRVALQTFFADHPFLIALLEFFGERLSTEDCLGKIQGLSEKPGRPHQK